MYPKNSGPIWNKNAQYLKLIQQYELFNDDLSVQAYIPMIPHHIPLPVALNADEPEYLPSLSEEFQVDALSGHCLMISRNLFEFIGGLDSNFNSNGLNSRLSNVAFADMAVLLQSLGWSALYQPKSTARYFPQSENENSAFLVRFDFI